jgi:hypothetical protein
MYAGNAEVTLGHFMCAGNAEIMLGHFMCYGECRNYAWPFYVYRSYAWPFYSILIMFTCVKWL